MSSPPQVGAYISVNVRINNACINPCFVLCPLLRFVRISIQIHPHTHAFTNPCFISLSPPQVRACISLNSRMHQCIYKPLLRFVVPSSGSCLCFFKCTNAPMHLQTLASFCCPLLRFVCILRNLRMHHAFANPCFAAKTSGPLGHRAWRATLKARARRNGDAHHSK